MLPRCLLLVVAVAVLVGCADDEIGAPPADTGSEAVQPSDDQTAGQAGSGQPGAPAAGEFGRDQFGAFVNPCAVLSESEVAGATNLTVIGSQDQGPLGCAWYVENVDPDILADDAITWQPFAPEQFEFQQQAIDQGLGGEEIPGLGNAAVYLGTEALGEVWVSLDELSFRVGNQFAFGNYDGRADQEALATALVDALTS